MDRNAKHLVASPGSLDDDVVDSGTKGFGNDGPVGWIGSEQQISVSGWL